MMKNTLKLVTIIAIFACLNHIKLDARGGGGWGGFAAGAFTGAALTGAFSRPSTEVYYVEQPPRRLPYRYEDEYNQELRRHNAILRERTRQLEEQNRQLREQEKYQQRDISLEKENKDLSLEQANQPLHR